MSRNPGSLTGRAIDERTLIGLGEFCRACGVRTELVVEMVNEGVLEPAGESPAQWRFRASAIHRARRAVRLARDLHVNWAGAALALDLLDEIERLRRMAHGRRRLASRSRLR